MPEPTCYVLDLARTCTEDQIQDIEIGIAEIKNYIVMDNNTKDIFAGMSGSDLLTGEAFDMNGLAGQDVGSGMVPSAIEPSSSGESKTAPLPLADATIQTFGACIMMSVIAAVVLVYSARDIWEMTQRQCGG